MHGKAVLATEGTAYRIKYRHQAEDKKRKYLHCTPVWARVWTNTHLHMRACAHAPHTIAKQKPGGLHRAPEHRRE